MFTDNMACAGLFNKHILKHVGISPSDPFALFFLSESLSTFISGSCLSVSGHIAWSLKAKWLTITHGCACCWYMMARAHHSCLKATSLATSLPLQIPANNFDRPPSLCVKFQELPQLWVITHLPLLDCIPGTTYLSTYVIVNLLS